MSALLDSNRPQRDGVTIPAIAIWIVLSMLLHVALMLWVPRMRMSTSDEKLNPPPMTVTLQSRPQQQPQFTPPQPDPVPAPATPPPKAAKPPPERKRPVEKKVPAPIIARSKPALEEPPFTVPAAPPVETPPVTAAPPKLTTPPPAETDLAAYVEARRRARGEAAADAPSPETERANRGALASAPLKSAPLNFNNRNPSENGGIFDIRRRGYDYAEFMFFGWNNNFRRNGLQLIEVRKGDNSDIDIAVIRRMIAIIREYENGDFQWHSKRTGKTSTLSARARDNAWLEEFMMKEFYDDLHRYR